MTYDQPPEQIVTLVLEYWRIKQDLLFAKTDEDRAELEAGRDVTEDMIVDWLAANVPAALLALAVLRQDIVP